MIKKNKIILIFIIGCLLFLLQGGVIFSAPVAEPSELGVSDLPAERDQSSNMGWLLFRSLLVAMAVLGLTVFGARFIIEKFQPNTTTNGNWMQIIDQVNLGTNKGLMLVEIDGKGFVLGISDHAINIISTIENQDRLDELRSLTVKPPEKTKFSSFFKKKSKTDFNQSLDKFIKRSRTLGERGRNHNE